MTKKLIPTRAAILTAILASCGVGLIVWGFWSRADQLPTATLQVFAPSSLTEILPDLARSWSARSKVPVAFQFGATSQMARQVREGAQVDVFIAANPQWIKELAASGILLPPTVRDVAGNRLVLAAAGSQPLPHLPQKKLSSEELKIFLEQIPRIALAGEGVPAAVYAEQALLRLQVWSTLKNRVVRGDNVRSVVHWLKAEAVPYGVVYKTDLNGTGLGLAYEFPPELHEPIVYTGAVVKTGAHPKYGAAFLDFLGSAPAQTRFEQLGFVSPASQRLSSKK